MLASCKISKREHILISHFFADATSGTNSFAMKADSFLADMNMIGQSVGGVPGYPVDPYAHPGYHPPPPPPPGPEPQNGSGRYLCQFSLGLNTVRNAQGVASLLQACRFAVIKMTTSS